jgi:O-antigen/teichoic acid export membrane protein
VSFFKTSFWGGLATGVTMLCGLITTKYVAVIIGPAGMAYVGQFTNVTVVLALLATAACVSGVVKYVAEHKNFEVRKAIIANAFLLSAICLVLTAFIVAVCSTLLAANVFNDHSFWDVFVIYALLLAFPTFNTIAAGIFNGLQQIRLMATLNITAAIINVVVVVVCANLFGLKGVLLANAGSGLLAFFAYRHFLKKNDLLPGIRLFQSLDRTYVKLLLGYSAMNIVSGLLAPSIQLFVRTKLLHNYDASTAGLWQANTRLSDYYLNFVYTVIGIYYLPKLSEITEPRALKREIRLGYARILPAVIIITLVIWFSREYIVKILLTNEFIDMLVLLKWQLIGDVIKIASWILAYLMVAKAMKKMFIGTELVFSTTFVLFNFLFINQYGLVGTVYAFALNYFLYLLTLVVLLRKYLF